MARSRTHLALGCLVAVLLLGQIGPGVQGQAPQSNELQFNGNSADQKTSDGDTTIISDNPRPAGEQGQGQGQQPAPGQQQQQQQQQQQPQQPQTVDDLESMPTFYDDNFGHHNHERPFFDLFGPMPGFGMGPPPPPPHPHRPSLWHQLLGGPGRLFDRLERPMRNFERTFEKQFRDLERSASGEGQDVSYFQRNGVAYVRTCTTKRVTPGGGGDGETPEGEQKQLGPLNQDPRNSQQDLSSEVPTIPSTPSTPSTSSLSTPGASAQ